MILNIDPGYAVGAYVRRLHVILMTTSCASLSAGFEKERQRSQIVANMTMTVSELQQQRIHFLPPFLA
jgi:hypothetical protein